MRSTHRALWTILIAAVACLASAQGLRIRFEEVFEGLRPNAGPWPLRVVLENGGRDARGTLTVTTPSFHMAYPVELPRGSRKVVPVYPEVSDPYAEVTATFSAPGVVRRINLNMPPQDVSQLPWAAIVSDSSGSYNFLRASGAARGGGLRTAYVAAEDAPDRAVGYLWASFVVLADGAERLSDRSVQALRAYLLRGGVLVFVGGASAPTLSDSRWADVLPAKGFQLSTADGSGAILRFSNLSEAPRGVAVQQGTPKPGAAVQPAGGAPLVYERAYGIGRVVVFAANPTEAPLEAWAGRGAIVTRALRQTEAIRVGQQRSQFAAEAPVPGAVEPVPGGTVDPFSAKLPPAGRIAAILGGYVLAVLVVGLVCAKGLKRGEWLWIAAPVVSVIFAAVLFGSARGLYSANLSTSTRALVLQQEGSPGGLVLGRTQMFFPEAGRYDLKMPVTDRVGATDFDESQYWRGGPTRGPVADLGAFDSDGIRVPAMPATSLAFRQVNYEYVDPGMALATVRLTGGRLVPGSSATFAVRNVSDKTLAGGALRVGGSVVAVPDLKPGAVETVRVASIERTVPQAASPGVPGVPMSGVPPGRPGSTEAAQWMAMSPTLATGARPVVFAAQVRGYRPGPQVGAEVGDGRSIIALVTTNLAVGP